MGNGKIFNMKEHGNFQWRKYIRFGIFLVVLFALLVLLFANLFIVREGEYKVVRQFGEVVRIIDKPGLNYKVPLIQNVISLPKYQMTYDVKEAEINTKDKKRIIIDNYAVWKIVDPKLMISNARTTQNAESRMEEFIYSTVRTELGRLNYDEIIDEEKSSRGSLNEQITEKVNELLEKDKYGITVVDVMIKRTDLPAENEQSVYTRMISERESKAQEYLSMGDAQKNKIIAETDKKVQEMLAKAKADAETIRGEGEAEAAQIYNQSFAKSPEFYSLFRTLESYKKTINGETVLVLPSDSPYIRYLTGSTN